MVIDLNDLATAIGQLVLRFRLRRRTAADWVTSNEILLAQELGVETDTGYAKLGDGTSSWNDLGYWSSHEAAPRVVSVVAGANIAVDDTDPENPVISATSGGGGGGGITQLAQIVTTAGQTSITLMSSIPNTYRQLKIIFEGGSTSANTSNSDTLLGQFNGDTGSNYRSIAFGIYPTSDFFYGANSATSMELALLCSNGASANEVTYLEMDVVNYAQTTSSIRSVFKTASWQGNVGEIASNGSCTWAPPTLAEVTSIVLSINANAFTTGSTATLYGIN